MCALDNVSTLDVRTGTLTRADDKLLLKMTYGGTFKGAACTTSYDAVLDLQYSCAAIVDCNQHCSPFPDCVPACIDRGSITALHYFQPLENCANPACYTPGGPCMDPASAACNKCVADKCGAELNTCLAH
jgi:hypothetical protein